ncbi:MAG: metalloregulator ArsR/SmtB family transcription factor [Anaerovoracaceae bacterium]
MRIRKETPEMEEDEILFLAKVSDALAHPVRIKIFRFIMAQNTKRELVCNKDVVSTFDYAQATISQHIKTLVKSGLVDVQKKDKFSYYYANIGLLIKYVNITKKF